MEFLNISFATLSKSCLISDRASCAVNVSAHYLLRFVKIYNKWWVYPCKCIPGLNQIQCWLQPNVCNKSISYFWMHARCLLWHYGIVLCVISSVGGYSAASCLSKSLFCILSFFFLFFIANTLLLPGHTGQAALTGKSSQISFYFSWITSQNAPVSVIILMFLVTSCAPTWKRKDNRTKKP